MTPRSITAIVLVALLVLAGTEPARAYLQYTVGAPGQQVRLKWAASPVRWYATDRGVPGVTPGAFQQAIAQAFGTWEAVPTASIAFQFAGFTSTAPFTDDDRSVVGFGYDPDLDRVLGSTGFLIDVVTGVIVESDIFINAAYPWSVAPAGEPGRYDLQSVATHEAGHFLGLGHSALGETQRAGVNDFRVLASGAVMFPVSFGPGRTLDRVLQPDDIAGVSDLYPDGTFRADTGAARGRVLRGGRGVSGAQVVAVNLRTGAAIGAFSTGQDGAFQIAGLTPGPHIIRVEPLDDVDIESFFNARDVDVDFAVTYSPRLFVAPAGGVGTRFDVTVRPK